jgi:hypothetical protein
MNSLYNTEAEIEAVVLGFESCRTDKTAFKHREHLTVAMWYLTAADLAQAAAKMRSGLLRFLDRHGVDRKKYNETITVFWIEMVALTLRNSDPDLPLVDKCNQVIASLQNPDLALDYYTRELLWSDKARQAFVTPDLRSWERS